MAVSQKAGNNRAPLFLRSYQNPEEISKLPDIKIWEAARATSAAPAYFVPMTVGEYRLVDGGLGANNPLGWYVSLFCQLCLCSDLIFFRLWTEVLAVFGPARSTSCFLSIGTGIPTNEAILAPGKLGSHAVEASYAAAACNTELTHILFRSLVNAFAPRAMGKKYWRLNVGEPDWDETKRKWYYFGKYSVHHEDEYRDIGALDDVGALKLLMEMTEKYVVEQEGPITECANALKAS